MEIAIIFLSLFILSGESFETNLTILPRGANCTDSTEINNYYCTGSLNLYAEGIWVTVDERWPNAPDLAVPGGSDQNGHTYYVIRAQFGDNDVVVGKWTPKIAFIPYGGLEHMVTDFSILLHKNAWWGDVTDDASKWIPGGIDQSGNIVYICKAQLPIDVDSDGHTVPGKYHNGRCYVSWQGREIGFDNGFNVLRQSLS